MHRFKVFSQNAGSFRPQVGLGMHLGSDFVNWEKFLFPSPCGVGDASTRLLDKLNGGIKKFPSP